MKRFMNRIITLLMVILFCASMTGCGADHKKENIVTPTSEVTSDIKVNFDEEFTIKKCVFRSNGTACTLQR